MCNRKVTFILIGFIVEFTAYILFIDWIFDEFCLSHDTMSGNYRWPNPCQADYISDLQDQSDLGLQ